MFQRLAALSAQERLCLLRAAIVVMTVRLALLVLPFRRVHAFMAVQRLESQRPGRAPARQWAWAVGVVARRIPGASCLTQALALQWLLAREGQAAIIHLGVAKQAAAGFEAHAWLESGGEILIGGDESLDRYSPILTFPADAI
jgi:hypothetical protein